MIEFWAFLEGRSAKSVDRAIVACEIEELKMTLDVQQQMNG